MGPLLVNHPVRPEHAKGMSNSLGAMPDVSVVLCQAQHERSF